MVPNMRPKRGPPVRSQGHCFSRPQVTRSLFFMRKLKQHRSQVVFLNCRGRAVALKMAPGRRSRKTPLGPPISLPQVTKQSFRIWRLCVARISCLCNTAYDWRVAIFSRQPSLSLVFVVVRASPLQIANKWLAPDVSKRVIGCM